MKTPQSQYDANHRVAKAVVCALYLILGIVSVETDMPYIVLFAGTLIWLFGVNPIAYGIEYLRKQQHQHNRF